MLKTARKIKTYNKAEAIELMAKYGYTEVWFDQWVTDKTRLQIVVDFTWAGKEFCKFRRASGKYKGNVVGAAQRP